MTTLMESNHSTHPHPGRIRFFGGLLLTALLLLALEGCVAPGSPYSGAPAQGAAPQGGGVGQSYGQPVLTSEGSQAGVISPAVIYPYPYVYATAPALIAPTFYSGWGNGYWYGNQFWPYRQGCAFYGGRYYGGYPGRYWRGRAVWHGGNAAYRGYGARY